MMLHEDFHVSPRVVSPGRSCSRNVTTVKRTEPASATYQVAVLRLGWISFSRLTTTRLHTVYDAAGEASRGSWSPVRATIPRYKVENLASWSA